MAQSAHHQIKRARIARIYFLWSLLILTFIFFPSESFAYDWSLEFYGSVMVTNEMQTYEENVLKEVARVVSKCDLPSDCQFCLTLNPEGKVLDVQVLSDEVTKTAKNTVSSKIRDQCFGKNPGLFSGKITLSFSLAELKNPPYRRNSDGIVSLESNLMVLDTPQLRESRKQIELLSLQKRLKDLRVSAQGAVTADDKLHYNLAVANALFLNGEAVEAHNYVQSAVNVADGFNLPKNDPKRPRWAALLSQAAVEISSKQQWEDAVACTRAAIRSQFQDGSFVVKGGCIRIPSIESSVTKVLCNLIDGQQYRLASDLLHYRVQQLDRMQGADRGLVCLEKIELSRLLVKQAQKFPETRRKALEESNRVFMDGLNGISARYGAKSHEYRNASLIRLGELKEAEIEADGLMARIEN